MIDQYTAIDGKTNICSYLSRRETKALIRLLTGRNTNDILAEIDNGKIFLIGGHKIEVDLNDYFQIENDYKDNMINRMRGLI